MNLLPRDAGGIERGAGGAGIVSWVINQVDVVAEIPAPVREGGNATRLLKQGIARVESSVLIRVGEGEVGDHVAALGIPQRLVAQSADCGNTLTDGGQNGRLYILGAGG